MAQRSQHILQPIGYGGFVRGPTSLKQLRGLGDPLLTLRETLGALLLIIYQRHSSACEPFRIASRRYAFALKAAALANSV